MIVPCHLRQDIIKRFHDEPKAGHFGNFKTIHRIIERYYWPNIISDVKLYISKCEICKASKSPNINLIPPMGKFRKSTRPWEIISMDFMGPFPKSKQGNIFLLVIVDTFSKFPLIYPIRNSKFPILRKILEEQVFNIFSVPRIIISDNGPQFVGKDFTKFLDNLNIEHYKTAVYSPQGNPVERVNQVIGNAIRCFIQSKNHKYWDQFIPQIGVAIRSAVHEVTKCTPFFLNFGMEMVIDGNDYAQYKNFPTINLEQQIIKLNKIRKIVTDRLEDTHAKTAHRYNLRARGRDFRVGDIVWRRNFALSDASKNIMSKLLPKWIKAEVREKKGTNVYLLRDNETSREGIYHGKDIRIN